MLQCVLRWTKRLLNIMVWFLKDPPNLLGEVFLEGDWLMPVLSGHSHTRNLCILPRRISYALVEQVQQERIFYPFVCDWNTGPFSTVTGPLRQLLIPIQFSSDISTGKTSYESCLPSTDWLLLFPLCPYLTAFPICLRICLTNTSLRLFTYLLDKEKEKESTFRD